MKCFTENFTNTINVFILLYYLFILNIIKGTYYTSFYSYLLGTS